MDTEEDNRLMRAVKAGEVEGIGALFEKHHAALVGFFRRRNGQSQLCEDLAQETFWRILRYRKTYDPRRPFRAWMYQIARNIMYDQAKKNASARRVFDDGFELVPERFAEPEVDVEREVERSDSKELLRVALGKLSEEKRQLIELCRFEELPYAEIAPMFGCSVGTMKVRLFRALQELKDVFVELGGEKRV